MLINEICKLTGLTKKAIEYYKSQGLIMPKTMDNGYRQYGDEEVAVLKEVSLLRKLGMGVTDIKALLVSKDKPALLAAHQSRITWQTKMLISQHECVSYIINSGYDIESSLPYIEKQLDEFRIIKDRLAEAFPGNYGLFVSFHFGRYLNEKIDTPEKEAAYGKILGFLDSLEDIPFPREIEEYMLENSAVLDESRMQSIDKAMQAAVGDYDSFMAQNRDTIEKYIEYIKSDEHKLSPAYKMKKLMMEFQEASGYVDIFIENMKILSPDYAAYQKKLYEANEVFLREYPDAANILEYQ